MKKKNKISEVNCKNEFQKLNDMKLLLKYTMFSLLMALFAACTADDISQSVGWLPDEMSMLNNGGQLCSTRSVYRDLFVNMYEGDNATEEINYCLTKPATSNVTLKVSPSRI